MTHGERIALPAELAAAIGSTLDLLVGAIAPARVAKVVPGWGTVELDRAERELATQPEATQSTQSTQSTAATQSTDLPGDPVLGCRCRLVVAGGRAAVLVEPSTEGRLAAALARHSEGWVAAYLVLGAAGSDGHGGEGSGGEGSGGEGSGGDAATVAARLAEAGLHLTASAPGPFGPERLVLGGPRDGPFVLVVLGP